MNVMLAAAASFVLVFFTVLIVVGTLYGVLLATEELIASVVRPAQHGDASAVVRQDESPS